jgi:hypothetical protein
MIVCNIVYLTGTGLINVPTSGMSSPDLLNAFTIVILHGYWDDTYPLSGKS